MIRCEYCGGGYYGYSCWCPMGVAKSHLKKVPPPARGVAEEGAPGIKIFGVKPSDEMEAVVICQRCESYHTVNKGCPKCVFTGGLKEIDEMTNAEKDKLQRLFDVMKKRIEKSDKYFRFFAGLYLGDQPISAQREYELIMREWKEDLRGKKKM